MNRIHLAPLTATILSILAMMASAPALAHPMHASGLAGGFAHPFLGLDHLLAMCAVGLWAAQLGGRKLWTVPLAFLGAMLAGAMLGFGAFITPAIAVAVEPMIAASVLVLGLLMVFRVRPQARWQGADLALVGMFALFHGYAHAVELPMNSSVSGYVVGFAVATAVLHGIGLLAGRTLRELALRSAGVPIALAGGWLMFGAVIGAQ